MSARLLPGGSKMASACSEACWNGLSGSSSASWRSNEEELRGPITRLQHDNEILQAQREELLAALHGLAGHVTQAVDEVLQRFGGEKPPK